MRRLLASHILLIVLPGFAGAAHAEQPKRKLSMLSWSAPPARRKLPAPAGKPQQTAKALAKSGYPATHLQRGLYLKTHGDLSRALIEFILAAQENPRQVRAFYEQAQLFKQMGSNRMACSALEQALAIAPTYAEARTMLISLRVQSGDLGAAARETGKLLSEQQNASRRQLEEKLQREPDERGLPAIQVTHGLLPEPPELPPAKPPEPKGDFAEVASRLGLATGEQTKPLNSADPAAQPHAPTLPLKPGDAKNIPGAMTDAGLPAAAIAEANGRRSLWRNMTSYTVAGFRQPLKQMSGLWPFKEKGVTPALPAVASPTQHRPSTAAPAPIQSVKADKPETQNATNMPDALKDVLAKVPDAEAKPGVDSRPYSLLKDSASSRISEFANETSLETGLSSSRKHWFELPKMPRFIPHVDLPLPGKKETKQAKPQAAPVQQDPPLPSAVVQPAKQQEEPFWKQALGFLPKLMPEPKPATANSTPGQSAPSATQQPKAVIVFPAEEKKDDGFFKSLTAWLPNFSAKPKQDVAMPKKASAKPNEKTQTQKIEPPVVLSKQHTDEPVSSNRMPPALAHDGSSTPESIRKILSGIGADDSIDNIAPLPSPQPKLPDLKPQSIALDTPSAAPLDVQRILGRLSRGKKAKHPKPLVVEQIAPPLPDAAKSDKIAIDPLAPKTVLSHTSQAPTPTPGPAAAPGSSEGAAHLPAIVHQILATAKTAPAIEHPSPSAPVTAHTGLPQPVPLSELTSENEGRAPSPILNSEPSKTHGAPTPIPASVDRHLEHLMVPVASSGLPVPSPVPLGVQQILSKVAPLKSSIDVPHSKQHMPSPTPLNTASATAIPLPSQPTAGGNVHGQPGPAPHALHPNQNAAPLPQSAGNKLPDALPPIVREIVQGAASVLPQISVPLAVAEAVLPQPMSIPRSEPGQGPTPMQSAESAGVSQAPAPIPAQLDKYLQNLMVPVMHQPPVEQKAQTPKERSKAMVASNSQHSGAFSYNVPTLQTDKAFLMGSQTRQIPQPPPAPVKKPAPAPEDAMTKRMRYLMEHGTGTLKPGEAFMYSEETGEGILFLPGGMKEKRKLTAPQDHDEVLRARRPDIIDPRDMQYSLNLLGKLLGSDKSQNQQQQQQQQDQYNAPTLEQLMKQTQKGFWGWFKDTMKM